MMADHNTPNAASQNEIIAELGRTAVALEWIASAVERIAERDAESSDGTGSPIPFPWWQVSPRVPGILQRRSDGPEGWGRQPPCNSFQWPLSCEDVMDFGCRECKRLRRFGDSATHEIAEVLNQLGSSDWVRK